MITREQADQFAHEWIEAWNSHDLDRILEHYSEDFTMASPRIAAVAQEPSGILNGKPAVASYWAKALQLAPELRFRLLATFVGADSVAIHYEGVRGPAVEVGQCNWLRNCQPLHHSLGQAVQGGPQDSRDICQPCCDGPWVAGHAAATWLLMNSRSVIPR